VKVIDAPDVSQAFPPDARAVDCPEQGDVIPGMKTISILYLSFLLFVPKTDAQEKTSSNRQHVGSGEGLFLEKCFACHSAIQDQVRSGPSLYGEMRKSPRKKTATEIRTIVLQGKGRMPPFRDRISEQDLNDLIAYIRSL
jgi:mono/diheme cytochrome c family protein